MERNFLKIYFVPFVSRLINLIISRINDLNVYIYFFVK